MFHKEIYKGTGTTVVRHKILLWNKKQVERLVKQGREKGKSQHEKKLIVRHPCLLHWDLKCSYFQRTLLRVGLNGKMANVADDKLFSQGKDEKGAVKTPLTY